MNELFIFYFLLFIYILRSEAITVHILAKQRKNTLKTESQFPDSM